MRNTMILPVLALVLLTALTGCNSDAPTPKKVETPYPIDQDDARRLRNGRLTGEDGINLFGGNDDEAAMVAGTGLAVNSYLWRATLDTLSFLPLSSADPVGGVIITDWYENPEVPGERFKANATIMDKSLRADGVRVSIFKQALDKKTGQWRDASTDTAMGTKLEDAILTRARELKIASQRR